MSVSLHVSRRVLHWVIAALVIVVMIPLGLVFTDFDNMKAVDAMFGKNAFNTFYDLHKSTGIMVLTLMVARLAAKALWPNPAYSPPLPAINRVGAKISHLLLYFLLLITPVIGWMGVSAYPAPVPFYGLFQMPALLGADRKLSELLLDLHGTLALTIIAVVSVHVAAALYHRYVRRDAVFDRISLRR